jgi:hypothetical protein
MQNNLKCLKLITFEDKEFFWNLSFTSNSLQRPYTFSLRSGLGRRHIEGNQSSLVAPCILN